MKYKKDRNIPIQKAQNVYDSAKADSDDIRAIKTWTMSRRNYEED